MLPIQKYVWSTLKKLGMPYTGTHIFRHGCASLIRTLTGSIDSAMAVTGHKDVRVAESYAELNDTVRIDASKLMEEHLLSLSRDGSNSPFQLVQ